MTKRSAISHSGTTPAGAARFWRSLDERQDAERRLDSSTREPEVEIDASMLVSLGKKKPPSDGVGRRQFLTVGGASAAALGLSGCLRRPVENILPYSRQPEYVLPGIPLHYATVLPRRGDAIGVLVESHEGRPTKIEGNPAHPGGGATASDRSHGGTDLQTQAQILNLYDLDRSAHPMRKSDSGRTESTWGDFDEFFREHLQGLEAGAGQNLRFLGEPTTSPTLLAAREALSRRFPRARFHSYSPVSEWNSIEGARLALGRAAHTHVDYSRAKVVVSLDHDFLLTESGNPRWQRAFAEARRVTSAERSSEMNRLYVVESVVSVTGSNADHRLRATSHDVGRYARALAAALGGAGVDVSSVSGGLGETGEFPAAWLGPVASDLAANRGRSAIVVGSRQPAWVHALAHALNAALGNVGSTVTYAEVLDVQQQEPTTDLRALVEDMRGSRVGTLVMLGGNPVYDAPADLEFIEALRAVATSIHLASHDDETSELCTWHLPLSHELEGWGDHRSLEGAYAIQQPMIAPLRGGRNAIELLGFASGERSWRAYHAVRRTFGALVGADGLDAAWRQALALGVVESARSTILADASVDSAAVTAALRSAAAPSPAADAWEVVFVPDSKVLDGRWANNPWLLELPDPVSKVSWDNAVMMSWGSAQRLGVRNGDLVRMSREGGAVVEIPAVVVPGMADGSLALSLGWGRRRAGQYATGRGFDVSPLRSVASFWFGGGVSAARAGGHYALAITQEHHSMEGRPLAIDATVAQYQETPDFAQWQMPTPAVGPLWAEVDYSTPQPPAQGGSSWSLLPRNRPPEEGGPARHAWGMTIDLTTCVGCNACVVACIAENNIPMVGHDQVARGRAMHWLRIDRYFTETSLSPLATADDAYDAVDEDALQVAFQPVACQHCEEAPCENVCPVNATAHSPEGLNDMAYNRCIGTRYCMNNCPYKVRRFNYLAYQGHVHELQRMQFNPNVSVRMRGVMEKCTYCVQRIQAARITSRNEGRRIRDGEIVTACAQACPSRAISFGDLNDADAVATRWAHLDRTYKLLADVGTQPRTTFVGKIRNPNPEMV